MARSKSEKDTEETASVSDKKTESSAAVPEVQIPKPDESAEATVKDEWPPSSDPDAGSDDSDTVRQEVTDVLSAAQEKGYIDGSETEEGSN